MRKVIGLVSSALVLSVIAIACTSEVEPSPTPSPIPDLVTATTSVVETATPRSERFPADPELEQVSIELDWSPPNANHSGIYAAIDQGFFEDENLDVQVSVPADAATIAQLVGSGQRDFGIFYQTDTMLARAEGVPVVAVRAIVQRPVNSLMALKSSGIARPADLKGKKVGYPGIEWNRLMLQSMLEADGLSLDDIELHDVGYALSQVLAAGTMDAVIGAYWSYESFVLEDMGMPVEIIYPEDYGVPRYYEMMLITSERMIEEQPETVERFVRAFTKGYRYVAEDSQRGIDILVHMNEDSIDELSESLDRRGIELLVPAWRDEDGKIGTLARSQWDEVGDYMKDHDLLPSDFDVDASWTDEFYRNDKVTVELDWSPPNANHSGIYAAIDQGYFEEENLEVEVSVPADAAAIAQLVGAGQRDFGIFYQTDTTLARAAGVPVVAVRAIVQSPVNSLMALKSSGITRPADLKGKKVGYPGIEWDELMLDAMLEADGLTLDDVELHDVGYALSQVLAAGTMDAVIGAYWSYESFVLEDMGHPVEIIYPEDWGVPRYYEMMLITSDRMIEEKPDVVKRFVNAFTKGYEYVAEDGQRGIDILVKLNQDSIDESSESLDRRGIPILIPAWLDSEDGKFGTLSQSQWDSVGDYMKSRDLIPQDFDVSTAWTDEFYE